MAVAEAAGEAVAAVAVAVAELAEEEEVTIIWVACLIGGVWDIGFGL